MGNDRKVCSIILWEQRRGRDGRGRRSADPIGSGEGELIEALNRLGDAEINVVLGSGAAVTGRFVSLEGRHLFVAVGQTVCIINMTFVQSIDISDPTAAQGLVESFDRTDVSGRASTHREVLERLVERLTSDTPAEEGEAVTATHAADEVAGSDADTGWARTRRIANELWDGAERTDAPNARLALNLLRSIPAQDATAEDCARIAEIQLWFQWKSAAARTIAAYFERMYRRSPAFVPEVDPLTRTLVRASLDCTPPRPDLVLRAIPSDRELLLNHPQLMLIFAAVNHALGRRAYLGYPITSMVETVVDEDHDALSRLVDEFRKWQEKLRQKGYAPFQFETGRVVPGLHSGNVFSWKGEYGFIQPEGTTRGSDRRLFHRTSIGDPRLIEILDNYSEPRTRVEFEWRDPPPGSNHGNSVAQAVVCAESSDRSQDQFAPPTARVGGDEASEGGSDGGSDDPASPKDVPLPDDIVRKHEHGLYEEVSRWAGEQLERDPNSEQYRELKERFEGFARRMAEVNPPQGQRSIDAGRRAHMVERDFARAEGLFRRALKEAHDCKELLAAGRELLSLLTRREYERREELVRLLEEKINGRTLLECAESRLSDVTLFYTQYAYNLVRVGDEARGFDQYRSALDLLDRMRSAESGKKIDDAKRRVERGWTGAHLHLEQWEEALKVISKHGDDPSSMLMRARALIGIGNHGEAKEVLDRLREQRPDDANVQRALSDLGKSQGSDPEDGDHDLFKGPKALTRALEGLVNRTKSWDGAEHPVRIDDRIRRQVRGEKLDRFPLGVGVGTLVSGSGTSSEDREDDGADQFDAIELMVAFALSDRPQISPSTRISLALHSLIALDEQSIRDRDDDKGEILEVAHELMTVVIQGALQDGRALSVEHLQQRLIEIGNDPRDPAHRRVLHLLGRTSDGLHIIDRPLVPSNTEESSLRRAVKEVAGQKQELWQAASQLRRLDTEAVDAKLKVPEQEVVERLLEAATAYVFTDTDEEILRRLKEVFRRIRAAAVHPTYAVDIDTARDLEAELSALHDSAETDVTHLSYIVFRDVVQHLRETCRHAVRATRSEVELAVDLDAPSLDVAVSDDGQRATVVVPLIIRNPLGSGQADEVEVLAQVALAEREEESPIRSATCKVGSIRPGFESICYLSEFTLDVPREGASSLKARIDVTVTCDRTLNDRSEEMPPVEREFDIDIELHGEDEFSQRLNDARRSAARLEAPPDLSGDTRGRIFGRENQIASLTEVFGARGYTAGPAAGRVIYGLQQTGKTTLANIVASQLAQNGVPVVFYSVRTNSGEHDDARDNDAEFFRDLCHSARQKLPGGSEAQFTPDVDGLVDLLERAKGSGPTPLLIIDEFTRALSNIHRGRMTSVVRTVWRDVTDRGLAHVLLIGHGSMERFQASVAAGEYPEFSSFRFEKLQFFDRDMVDRLCEDPFKSLGLRFSRDAKQEVYAISAGHAAIALRVVAAGTLTAIGGGRLAVNRGDVVRGVQNMDTTQRHQLVGHLVDPQMHDDTSEDKAKRRALVEALATSRAAAVTFDELRDRGSQILDDRGSFTDEDVRRYLEELASWEVVRLAQEIGDRVVHLRPTLPVVHHAPNDRIGSNESANSSITMRMEALRTS